MYKFKDTTIQKCDYNPFLPVSAMNYNGLFLEEYIEGYQTLSVEGREMISLEQQTDNLLIGSLISSQRLPSRTLTVKYLLINKNPELLLVEFRKLMNYLYRKENVPIYFNDELDVIYQGRYSSSDEPAGDATSVVSSFQIYCEDPRKYSFNTYETNGFIGIETPIATFPTRIEVKASNNSQLKIFNSIETITMLPNSVKNGDVVIFDFTKGIVLINNKIMSRSMSLSSDFENFELRQGSTVTCTNGSMTIFYKGVTL